MWLPFMLRKRKIYKLLYTQAILCGQLSPLLQELQIQLSRLRPIRCLRIIGLAQCIALFGIYQVVHRNAKIFCNFIYCGDR